MTPEWAIHGTRAVAIGLAAVAAFTDWRKGEIPNWLTLPPLVAAPILWAIVDWPWGATWSIGTMLAAAAVPYLLFWRNACGGGDVKLFAAVGAVVGGAGPTGLDIGIESLFYTLCFAALYSLVKLTWQGKLFRTLLNAMFLAVNPLLPKNRRREISEEAMSTVRLGGSALVGTLVAVALQYPLWLMRGS